MAIIEKPKIEIKKRIYYYFLILISIYILSYTIYFLSAMILNTEIYDNIQDKKVREDMIVKWMTGKVVSYIINAFLIIFYLIYISLGRNRMKLGFVFMLIWIILFIGMGVSTHILPGSHDEIIRLVMGIISTISSAFIIIGILFMWKDLYIRRKMKRREMYRVFKNKL